MAKMGRPKGSKNNPFKAALTLALNEAEGDVKKLRLVADKLVEKALEGDLAAIKEVADRTDGKPTQAVTGADGGPIQFMDLTQVDDAKLEQLERLVGEIATGTGADEDDQGGEGSES